MKNKKEIKHFLKKHIITIWLIVAVVSFFGIVAFAKFNEGQNQAKRVVSTGKNDKVLFTSNLLTTANARHQKNVAKGYASDSTYDINIYNYDRTKISSFYPGTINYTLTASLVKSDGTTQYDLSNAADLNKLQAELVDNTDPDNPVYKTIDIYELTNGTPGASPIIRLGTSLVEQNLSSEQLVPGENGSAVKRYRVVMPKESIDSDIYLKIAAEPNGHSDLPTSIGGLFFVQSQNINVTTGWSGEFTDSHSIAPSGYDAFNFRISGAGTATKTLKWNSTYVQPNKQQISEYFSETLTDSMSQIQKEFPVQSGVYSYDIQFYVKDAAARAYINGLTWDQLIAANIVTFE